MPPPVRPRLPPPQGERLQHQFCTPPAQAAPTRPTTATPPCPRCCCGACCPCCCCGSSRRGACSLHLSTRAFPPPACSSTPCPAGVGCCGGCSAAPAAAGTTTAGAGAVAAAAAAAAKGGCRHRQWRKSCAAVNEGRGTGGVGGPPAGLGIQTPATTPLPTLCHPSTRQTAALKTVALAKSFHT